MDLCHLKMPRKKRLLVALVILLVSGLIIGVYVGKNEVSKSSSSLSSSSALSPANPLSRSQSLLFNDHKHRVVHAIDHGCYLQTSNLTHHRHSSRLLADRRCEQKLPVALIIGGALCGTQTLRSALSFHPDVVVPEAGTPLIHDTVIKDKDDYRVVMPYSLASQITVDESQEYLYTNDCSKELANMIGPKLKVIALLRDPVARAMSEYLVLTSRSGDDYYQLSLSSKRCFPRKENRTMTSPGAFFESEHGEKTKSKRHVKKLARRDKHQKRERQKERTKRKTRHHNEKRSALQKYNENTKGSPVNPYKGDDIIRAVNATFEETVLGTDNGIKGATFLLQRSIYVSGLKKWRKVVQPENMLILDAEEFARNPAGTMKVVEKFLGLQPYFQPEFFDFDLASGRLCFNSPVRSCVEPLEVRQPLPVLADSLVSKLREFFIPWIKIQNRVTKVYFPHLGEHPLVFTPFR